MKEYEDSLALRNVAVTKYMSYQLGMYNVVNKKLSSHHYILRIRRMQRNQISTEEPQILSAVVQNFVARATWCP